MSDVYAAVEAIAQDTSLPTVTICDVLEVSRSAYYDWLTREPGDRSINSMPQSGRPQKSDVKRNVGPQQNHSSRRAARI
ncbi:MAG: hypothetical protein K8U57_00205 [Planctomycetes bacterium]|nr:hypothetical protein [Planctomycetota bacterium]